MKRLILFVMLLACTSLSALSLAADGSEGHGFAPPPEIGKEAHG